MISPCSLTDDELEAEELEYAELDTKAEGEAGTETLLVPLEDPLLLEEDEGPEFDSDELVTDAADSPEELGAELVVEDELLEALAVLAIPEDNEAL